MVRILKSDIVLAMLIGVILFFFWANLNNEIFRDMAYPDEAHADTATGTLNAVVRSSLTFTVAGTCDNGKTSCDTNSTASFGTITAGTANDANVNVKAVSNDTINMSVGRQRANPAYTLASDGDTSIYIDDTGGSNNVNAFNSCSGVPNPQIWAAASKGLGFSVWAATNGKNNSCWGTGTSQTDASNFYAAMQASASASTAWTSSSVPADAIVYASVGFKIDVSSSQRATSYTGQAVFTAVVTP